MIILSTKTEKSIDTVVTHTALSFCYLQTKRGFERSLLNDSSLEEDVKNERRVMILLYNILLQDNHKIKDWMYGHYHQSHTEFINGVRFSLLDIDELKEH